MQNVRSLGFISAMKSRMGKRGRSLIVRPSFGPKREPSLTIAHSSKHTSERELRQATEHQAGGMPVSSPLPLFSTIFRFIVSDRYANIEFAMVPASLLPHV